MSRSPRAPSPSTRGVVAVRSGRAPTTTSAALVSPRASQETALGPPRQYGDVVASDEVHDEIRALGNKVKRTAAACLPRDGTNEAQVMAAVRQFGPSKASKQMLNRENEAAVLACEKGLYIVWRCLQERVGGGYLSGAGAGGPRSDARVTHGAHKMLSGANDDFCTRIGYSSTCFCGHTLAAHALPVPGGGGGGPKKKGRVSCGEAGCGCPSFRYIPNCPEEIGEGWLSRRRGWNPAAWSPKCHCGHGSKEHEPVHLSCRTCACPQFSSHFLCVVCDQPWEAHETVCETEAERLQCGRPVREDYFPLSGVDWDVRELVLDDATGGGLLAPPPSQQRQAITASASPGRTRTRGGASPAKGRNDTRQPLAITDSGADTESLPDHCRGCATIFRSNTSKFCSKCGRPRQG